MPRTQRENIKAKFMSVHDFQKKFNEQMNEFRWVYKSM